MRVSAKADYAVRAALELAGSSADAPMSRERIASAQGIPLTFLENILLELKHAGIVRSFRGADGGYGLARPAAEITIADVIRAVDGPMASVRGERIETLTYAGSASMLRDVWVAVRAGLRNILENVTLADVVAGSLPSHVVQLTEEPEAWISAGRVHRRRERTSSVGS